MASLARQIGLKHGYFLTREQGEKAYELIELELQHTPEGSALVLDFPPSQLVDSSFADESAVRLGEEILKGRYGDRCLLLKNLTADSLKNFEAVISLRGIKLPLLAFGPGLGWKVLGHLEKNLSETLVIVIESERVTASDLVSRWGLAVNTASTRLKRLHNLHLVRREYEITDKGLQYIYYAWQVQ
jgi:hypothetical protein